MGNRIELKPVKDLLGMSLGDAFDGSYYDGIDLYCHIPEPIPFGFESDEGCPPNINDWLCVAKGTKEKYEAAEPWNYYETIKEME